MSPLFSKWVKHGGVILWSDAESEWLHLKFCSDYRLQEEPRRTSILQYLNKKKKEKEHDTTRQHLTKYITAANSNYPSTQPRWWQIVSYPTSSVHFDKTNFPLTHRIPQSSHLWTFPVVSTMGSVGCVELKARKREDWVEEGGGGGKKEEAPVPCCCFGCFTVGLLWNVCQEEKQDSLYGCLQCLMALSAAAGSVGSAGGRQGGGYPGFPLRWLQDSGDFQRTDGKFNNCNICFARRG